MLKKTLIILQNSYETTQELQADLYAVVKIGNEEPKELKSKQKRYFQIIYNLLLGQNSGPKMGLLLSAMDYDLIYSRLQNKDAKKLTRK